MQSQNVLFSSLQDYYFLCFLLIFILPVSVSSKYAKIFIKRTNTNSNCA